MGVSSHDIFGDSGGARPATPGSYGRRPSGYRLPDALRLGAVRLQVADLARSVDYYENILGLRAIDRAATHASLAPHGSDRALVHLTERRGARPAPGRGVLGLYHFAILLSDRPSLGRFVAHLASVGARAGSADHLVSEALYLQDPDNLGIEVYADRPRETWRHIDQQLVMASDPLDVDGLIESAGGSRWTGMPSGTTMGHLHLHVGDTDRAGAFYSDALGFDRMVWHYPGALFLAAGGYHHHLGANTWAGRNAVPAPDDMARLTEWTIELPTAADVAATAESLERSGNAPESQDGTFLLRDPWTTSVRIRQQ